MKIGFLPINPEQARELSEMRRNVWLTTYRGIYPDKMLDEFDYPFHDAKNLSMINSEDFSVLFITANSEKAGYLILQKRNPLYVQSLYLLEPFRRKGIGTEVFSYIRNFCREAEIQKFYLGCNPENKNALAFYEKMGGTITSRDEGHENKNENSVKIEFFV